MTAKRRDRGPEQREIEQLQVREVMTEDVEREHMSEGCYHVGKAENLDERDQIVSYE